MTEYPLHTTGDARHIARLLQEPQRRAVWVHVRSDKERVFCLEILAREGWRPVDRGLPVFFVVGVRTDVTEQEEWWLAELIRPKHKRIAVEFLGKMFGYSDKEITWYIEQTIPPSSS